MQPVANKEASLLETLKDGNGSEDPFAVISPIQWPAFESASADNAESAGIAQLPVRNHSLQNQTSDLKGQLTKHSPGHLTNLSKADRHVASDNGGQSMTHHCQANETSKTKSGPSGCTSVRPSIPIPIAQIANLSPAFTAALLTLLQPLSKQQASNVVGYDAVATLFTPDPAAFIL